MLGVIQGFIPIAEFPVLCPSAREGTGRIDMVWTFPCPDCGTHPVAAFEIAASGQGYRNRKKLEELKCPWKVIIGAGTDAGWEKLRGSPLPTSSGVELLVVYPTDDPEASRRSNYLMIQKLILDRIGFMQNKKYDQIDLDEFLSEHTSH